MAMMTCPDCKSKISLRAKVCPKCGLPITRDVLERADASQKMASTVGTVIFGGLALLIIGMSVIGTCDLKSPNATKSGRLIPGGSKKQAQRKELIGKLIANGVFTKIGRPGTMLRVYTGQAWNGLTIDDKRAFVSVVYAHEYAGKHVTFVDLIAVYDGFTGKELGTMNGEGELDL